MANNPLAPDLQILSPLLVALLENLLLQPFSDMPRIIEMGNLRPRLSSVLSDAGMSISDERVNLNNMLVGKH